MTNFNVHIEHRFCEVYEVIADDEKQARQILYKWLRDSTTEHQKHVLYVGVEDDENDDDLPAKYMVEEEPDDDPDPLRLCRGCGYADRGLTEAEPDVWVHDRPECLRNALA